RRIDFAAGLFQRLGPSRADASRRALLAYSAYLGHAQVVHATPQLLPRTEAAKRAYLDDVRAVLTVSRGELERRTDAVFLLLEEERFRLSTARFRPRRRCASPGVRRTVES